MKIKKAIKGIANIISREHKVRLSSEIKEEILIILDELCADAYENGYEKGYTKGCTDGYEECFFDEENNR